MIKYLISRRGEGINTIPEQIMNKKVVKTVCRVEMSSYSMQAAAEYKGARRYLKEGMV